MKRISGLIAMAACVVALTFATACGNQNIDTSAIPDASAEQIVRVEPPCWWVGMKTQLQLLVYGPQVGGWDVAITGGKGVKVTSVDRAESPNYLFVNIDIAPKATPGTYYLVFSKGDEQVKFPYEIAARSEGSADRGSFGLKDAIYLIMPDRFANADPSNDSSDDTFEKARPTDVWGRHGGDLKGIMEHLDYIRDLGMTAIWLTPALEDNELRESYHGYACTNYYKIDSRIGDNELYRELVSQCHARGLKVIMDIVPNHCGDRHWWMADLPFADWIHQWPEYTHSNCNFALMYDPYASEAQKQEMVAGWFDTTMVDMNLDNPHLLSYFKQWGAWWIEWAGLDGFRVDTFPYNEQGPMSEWNKSILTEYPNFNIVGECWTVNIPQLAYWQAGNPNKDGYNSNLPAIMDFPLHSAICQSINTDHENWDEGMTKVFDSMTNDFFYADPSNIMIFPGNHDTARIMDICGGAPAKLKIVMTLMATLRGYPQIFAGDEIGQRSRDSRNIGSHGPLRRMFEDNWAADAQMKDLHDYFCKLFNWRSSRRYVYEGGFRHYLSHDNTYAYFRHAEDGIAFVYVNNNLEPRTIPWGTYDMAAGLTEGVNPITGERIDVTKPVVVGPRQALIIDFK